MFAAVGKAIAIFGPIAAVATVLLNVLDASRPVALAVVMTISGAGSVVAVLFLPPEYARKASRPHSHGSPGA